MGKSWIAAEETTQQTYLYAWRLRDAGEGPGGQRVMRVRIGQAPFRRTTESASGDVVFAFDDYNQVAGEFFDGGNSLLIPRRPLGRDGGRAQYDSSLRSGGSQRALNAPSLGIMNRFTVRPSNEGVARYAVR